MSTEYAVLDVETTGVSPRRDKITDIAVFIFDGDKIIDSFESLVNPECRIPERITALTGISNLMVEDAPCFYEIAKKIIEITEQRIVVGHNVNFDYNFIRHEYKRLGYNFKRDTIDTVKLSRKMLPALTSHNLGNVCKHLKIRIKNRHRAAGDALATVELFAWLKQKDMMENGSRYTKVTGFRGLHSGLKPEKIRSLPEETGVYYFYDEHHKLLYIGKSNNIYKRVMTHLNNETTDRAVEMKSLIADVDFETTGSELVALLQESHEIKKHKPRFNRAQRRAVSRYGLYVFEDDNGYLQMRIERNDDVNKSPVLCFSSKKTARQRLFQWAEAHQLCQKLCGLYESAGACFGYALGECNGACVGEEPADIYNSRVETLLKKYSIATSSMLIVEKGRNEKELAVVQLQNGKYTGHGYILKVLANRREELLDCIKHYPDNRDVQMIIRQYVKKYPRRLKMLKYTE
ncbi:MAG: exonuclease domain-containing protein [Candidatus Delongbacteria bacterium]|nr:exonuclease domain-containing protein [Candidatus Delongbacteria bacterium]